MTGSIVNIQDAPDSMREDLRERLRRLEASKTVYRSWGSVHILGAGIRLPQNEWVRVIISGDQADGSPAGTASRRTARHLEPLLLRKRKHINFLLYTRQQHAARVQETIPPILDDQAQLIGPSLRYCAHPSDPKKIYRALKGRYAVNLSGGHTVCIGKSLEEAYVAAQLVEKTSKAFLEARALGGAKPINRLEAWAMHKFYMLKYSRESEKNK